MIRTEDDLRAVYTEAPAGLGAGLDAAEQRLLDALATRPPTGTRPRTRPRTGYRHAPRRTGLAVAASAAAVIGIVVAVGAVVGHRASDQPGSAPTIPGPYRHTRVHVHNPGALNQDDYIERWVSTDGHSWATGTSSATGLRDYSYGKDDPHSPRYAWSAGFLRALPADPRTLRTFLLTNPARDLRNAEGKVTPAAQAQYLFETVESFWKDNGFRYLSRAKLAAIVHLLQDDSWIVASQVRDPLGRPALRFGWRYNDGSASYVLFDPKNYAYLGDHATSANGHWSDEIVEVDETTDTVPKAVVDGTRKENAVVPGGISWAQPVIG